MKMLSFPRGCTPEVLTWCGVSLLAVALFVSLCGTGQAADPPASVLRWEPNIAKFEAMDQKKPVEEGGILFVGSSSITKWDTDAGFPSRSVINRGFGGSQTSDVLHYMDRMVLNYKPSVIVFYCGDNDIARGKTAEEMVANYREFTRRVHDQLPETDIVYLPIKPSLSRWKLWPEMSKANGMILADAQKNKHLHYCDTATVILNEQGEPRPDFFVKDGLHLSQLGYDHWNRIVDDFLKTLE